MANMHKSTWPELNFEEIKDTVATLHQWLQIVGKIRLRTMPWQNHSWHTALYVSPNGYSTHGIPYQGRFFQLEFDFKQHQLQVQCSETGRLSMDLPGKSVADFYREVFELLQGIGIDVKIHARPNEMEPAIPFAENTANHHYDPEAAYKIWQAMSRANAVFNTFRTQFVGKASPVHLFWGAFDLAVTRFSGDAAPLHPGGMPNMPLEVMQEAYSQEVSSVGFWPGSAESPLPVFYSYAYPADASFGQQAIQPKEAFWSEEMGEFFLKYEDVQRSDKPEETLMSFLQSTYETAANTSGWDRTKLERPEVQVAD
ncbi:MAG: DUF5996 family protein [Bacteroidota bacterium]